MLGRRHQPACDGISGVSADRTTYANRLAIGVMALVAEEEARATSARTKTALAVAKARGVKLGNPQLQPGNSAAAAGARAAWSASAERRAAEVLLLPRRGPARRRYDAPGARGRAHGPRCAYAP